ncbi:MAG: MltA domain-containing protein [Phycisphaerae bacterium]|nr:MltA domain-containing protein [Phycisphaerae bacterium]MDD5380379.1 MltA domain-containing protein [Phycisphaerae bacterium]
MKTKVLLYLLLSAAIVITGCKAPMKKEAVKPPYNKPLLPGQPALRKITNPSEIPDFTLACFNVEGLKPAAERSLNYLGKPSSQGFFPVGDISHQIAVDSLKEFSALLGSGVKGSDLNAAIRDKFDVYMSVGCDDNGTVLFTGYYTPIFEGSFTPGDRFKYPLYKQPENLVKDANGTVLGRREADGSITPYPPRAVIEDAMLLRGRELIWLTDPFEAYIAHIQGSAKIRLPDGNLVTVGYVAHNGHEYKSMSQAMVRDGKISSSQLSLAAIIKYFKEHPDEVSYYTRLNPRFVFFSKQEGDPRGSLNEPVTPMRTIATDKSIFPRGSLTFISTTLPREEGGSVVMRPFTGFMLDQDTGGAIRAPGRCDVYMGIGDTAGKLAGQTYQEGKLYYLFLKQASK